ncbi:MAG: WGR domain-containing protein [bacterium]|nr:WGR domain-containing protein [bacterium]
MKLIEQASLAYRAGKSDKVYEVDLCEVGAGLYVVNFRYGKRGSTLKDGTKTVLPVNKDKAEKIFNDLVSSKVKKGYMESGAEPLAAQQPRPSTGGRTENLSKRKQRVLEQLERAIANPSSRRQRPLKRLIWRAGELRLKGAGPLLLNLRVSNDHLLQYCRIWSLGRCGDESALPMLEDIFSKEPVSNQNPGGQPEHIARIAMEAYRALAGDHTLRTFLDRITDGLPGALRSAHRDDSPDAFFDTLCDFLKEAKPEEYRVLSALYLLDDQKTRPALLKLVKEAPFAPNYFQRFRRIFKASEFRGDAEVFGILAYRFEKQRARANQHGYYDSEARAWVSIATELAKTNSKYAYTGRTRDYLRLRSWRTLKSLGEQGDDLYVKMAVGVLLNLEDLDAREPRSEGGYDWSSNSSVTFHYDAYADFYVHNCILFTNSSRYKRCEGQVPLWVCRRGYSPGRPAPARREEAYPDLWDKNPIGLLHLLADSGCQMVHEFAVKVLRNNNAFCKQLDTEVVLMMLARPYAVTNSLGLELARDIFKPEAPDYTLVAALLNCPLQEARDLAFTWINANRTVFVRNIDFMVGMCFSAFEDMRKFARQIIGETSFSLSQQQAFVKEALDRLLLLKNDESSSHEADAPSHGEGAQETPSHGEGPQDAHSVGAIASDVGETLRLGFAALLRKLDMATISKLLAHDIPEIVTFAGQVLVDHESPPEKLPPSVIRQLIESEHESVRRVGILLFGKLPLQTLFDREDVVLGFCLSPLPDVRQAVRPILEKLAASNTEFGHLLCKTLTLYLLEKEPHEGFYKDTTAVLTGELAGTLEAVDRDLMLRLLKSRSMVVQEFGGFLLLNFYRSAEFNVRMVMRFGNHDILKVRQYAWQWCRDNGAGLKNELKEIVRLFDSKWEDSRQFAFDYFKELFDPERGEKPAAEVLVGICDSVHPDVQRFGCDLVTRYFEEKSGEEYLLKLSQHPSVNLQLFVTNYLARYAGGSPERLKELSGYFISVLSRVNKGRAAKSRILAFFREESLKNKEIAAILSAVLTRVSATCAIGDKAECIDLMRDISYAYPDIDLPVKVKPIRMASGANKGGQYGV